MFLMLKYNIVDKLVEFWWRMMYYSVLNFLWDTVVFFPLLWVSSYAFHGASIMGELGSCNEV